MISARGVQSILRSFSVRRVSVVLSRKKSTNVDDIHAGSSNVRSNDMPNLDENPFKKEEEQCILCKYNIEPDYKNVRLLSQFQSRYTGQIYGRHITGLCKHKQERLVAEVQKAQNAGFMAYMTKDPRYVHDPQLFDPNHPFRPHKF